MADLQEPDNSGPENQEMSETIRATFREIQSRGKDEVSVASAPLPEAGEPAATETAGAGDGEPAGLSDRPRDEKGRFAPKAETPAEAAPAPDAPKAPVKQAYVPKWKKEALEAYGKLPPELRTVIEPELQRRDEDFHKGIEGYKTKAQVAEEWEKAISPYAATFQSMRVQPQQAVSALLATEHALRYGTPAQKAALLQTIIRDYGIQLPSGEQAQMAPQIDPALQQVSQQVAQLQWQLQQREQEAMAAKERELSAQIEAFKADKPYYETLRPMMAALLQTKQADDLPDAYEKAFSAHPATKAIAEAQQRERWEKERQAKAEAARKAAAVNIKPKGVVAPSASPKGEMRETIAAKLRELGMAH